MPIYIYVNGGMFNAILEQSKLFVTRPEMFHGTYKHVPKIQAQSSQMPASPSIDIEFGSGLGPATASVSYEK